MNPSTNSPKWTRKNGDRVSTIEGLHVRIFRDIFRRWTVNVEGSMPVHYTPTLKQAIEKAPAIAQRVLDSRARWRLK